MKMSSSLLSKILEKYILYKQDYFAYYVIYVIIV